MNSKRKLPPGPKSLWPGQQLLAFRRDPPNFLRQMAARYGDVTHFGSGRFHFFLLNHPDFIKDVYVTRQHCFHKGDMLQRSKFLLGEGLLTSEGEHHDRQRRLVWPAFHRPRIARYCDLMVEHTGRLVESWEDGQVLGIGLLVKQLTLLIACEALFGADVKSESAEVAKVINDALNRFSVFGSPRLDVLGTLKRVLPLRTRPISTARDLLDPLVYRIIAERRREGRDRGDLLSMLLRAEEESGEGGAPMSDKQVRDEVITLILAGYESTSNAICWALHLLSKHPKAQVRLHEELAAALGSRRPCAEDLPRLPYTGMVFAEAMRLYPPAWIISRRPTEDYEVDGYVVPRGSLILMSQYVMHHDPRFFPDPFRFDPERWTEEARRARPEFSYFPFGGGKRRCIGDGFALAEGVMILATLVQSWRVSPASTSSVRMLPGIVLRPGPELRLRVERRSVTEKGFAQPA